VPASVTETGKDILAPWRDAWPVALAAWSRFTRLRDPRLCSSTVDAAREGLSGSFAMIRLVDKSVVIDLEQVADLGLTDYPIEILAHEIGHHVLAPATASDSFRLIARLRKALPTLERHAPMVSNLFTDLLINDRLQRSAGLRMADVYARLRRPGTARPSRLWTLYMGIYESLWGLQTGSLGGPKDDKALEGDAWLGARLIRVYARDWMKAAGRFGTLVLPYLVEDIEKDRALTAWHDTRTAAQGSEPSGGQDVDDNEEGGAIHASQDPLVTGEEEITAKPAGAPPSEAVSNARSGTGQKREPFEYGEILRAAGIQLSDQEIAIRYYRERALPHLVSFPVRPGVTSGEPQMEGLEPWDIGASLDEIAWLETLGQSPVVVPGVTTVRRVYGVEPGQPGKPEPVDLDLYVDSSGSMPDPRRFTSYLTLAGAIVALSALKAGARVQATLWSGKAQWIATDGFVRDERAILGILTGFFGGATAFPIHRLRDTYARRKATDRPVHILQISDDGITTMFDRDERGGSGWDIARHALEAARGGGTMALNLYSGLSAEGEVGRALRRASEQQGWDIHRVSDMSQLTEFARAFSRRRYGSRAP
jgi:hypothetical protein